MTNEKLCPADHEPCHVVALVSHHLEEVPEEEAIWECLPCSRCRVGLSTIRDLKGTRLGRHERRILLSSAGPDEHPKRIAQEAETRSAYEALQRARRKLEGAGLIEVTEETPVRIRLSPAGHALRQEIREYLEDGKPIRWTPARLKSVAKALGSQDADFLFLYFIETLKDKAERWGKHLDRISRVDPALGERFRALKNAADTVLGTIEDRQKERWDQVQAWLEARWAEENDAGSGP
ncbi:MAG: hypothetical protein PVJ76_16730 [Gemmatimonadota bacterium]